MANIALLLHARNTNTATDKPRKTSIFYDAVGAWEGLRKATASAVGLAVFWRLFLGLSGLYLVVSAGVANASAINTIPTVHSGGDQVRVTGAMSTPPSITVSGNVAVNVSGAATYSIPIVVPPGTNAMVPSLSLDYSSSGGDGIVGLGWSLDGLPSITRCPQTVAQDGVHGGVNYNTSDRFCFGGQRLILVSGAYGASNSIYRMEIDTFSEFIAHGTQGNGPAWFEVHNKSGQVLQFGNPTNANGNASNAQILAAGTSTVATWALNQVQDPRSNYVAITYTDDAPNSQYYPVRIDYTGNQNAGTATYNSVRFIYTQRPASDIVPTYQAGSLIQTTVLLSHIETFTGSSLTTDYQLSYNQGSSGLSHDQLNKVAQCNTNGNCLAPTTFGWQGGSGLPAMMAYPAPFSVAAVAGDFNGDGLTDLYCPDGSSIWLGTQSGMSFTKSNITTNSQIGGLCTRFFNVADLDGDGFSDLFFMGIDVTSTVLNNQNGELVQITTPTCNYFNSCNGVGVAIGGDFNGDGRADVWDGQYGEAYYSNGSTVGANGTFVPGESVPTGTGRTFLGDFDGDGCTDFLVQTTGAGAVQYSCQPAVATAAIPALLNTYPYIVLSNGDYVYTQMVVGDFNGDGKADILFVPPTGSGTLFLSTGTGFIASSFQVPSTWGQYGIITGDWSGDGKTDIALIADGQPGHLGEGTSHQIWLSTGNGFVEETTIPNTNSQNSFATATVADWNNDGASDIWLWQTSGATEYLFSYKPELMTTINNGIGATTTITYDKINNPAIYTKGSGAVYPTQDVVGPLYVVSQTSTSNGVGGTSTNSYTYAGAKSDLSGRGTLGFSQITSVNPAGVVTTTNYQTAFPYTGFISSQTVASGSVTLQSVVNTYTAPNEGGSSLGSAYYFVSLHQSQKSGSDLDGSALPTTTTIYTYDSFGNVVTQAASASDGSSSTTTNSYNNDTTNWFIGQLLTSSVTNTVLGGSAGGGTKPTGSLMANPANIGPGGSATLVWTSSNATSASISGVGSVTPVSEGSVTVTPSATTTYTLTLTNAAGTTTATATVTVPLAPTGSLTASPTAINPGGSATLTWSSAHATSASINNGVGSVTPTAGGSVTVTPAATTTYTLTLTGPGGTTTEQATVSVNPPTGSLSASPATIAPGGSSTLTWTGSGATSASISPTVGGVSASGGSTSVSPSATTTYTLTLTGAGGTTTKTATVTVTPLPTGSFSASPAGIPSGGTSTLSWSSSGATSATLNGGTFSNSPVGTSGSTNVTLSANTTYTLTLTNVAGSTNYQATVTIVPPPTGSLSANPTWISPGGSSTLTWTGSGATSASISPTVGSVSPSGGSTSVSPTTATTYTLTLTGTGGTTTQQATVSIYGPPTGTFTDSDGVNNSTLTWTSSNATSASISPTVGSVALNGSTTVAPLNPKTYTLTLTGSGGTATYQVSVPGYGGGGGGCPRCFLPDDPDTATPSKYLSDLSSLLGVEALRPRPPAGASDLRDMREGG